jgi:ABC-type sugar transport system, periplasmic component
VKKKALAVILAFALIILTSCGDERVIRKQKEQIEITLSWWGNDARNEYTLEAVKLFEKKHPDIKVKCSYTEWSGYEKRNQVRMFSDTEADVMQINVGWLAQYSPDGKGYYDIEKLSDTFDLSNFDDDMLDYGRRNGVLNAIPIAMNTETIYINKTIYDSYGLDVPKTWDDYFAAAKVMKKDGVYPLAGASKSIWLYCIAYAEQKNGKTFFNDKNEITFDQKDFEMMIDFYKQLVNEGVIPKVEDFQRYNIDNGTYAGTVAWVSDAMNYFQAVIDEGNEVVVADYPAFDNADSGVGWYEKPATMYAISERTEHPKEAAMLLDFMMNSAEWAELQGIEKGIPVSQSARNHLDKAGLLSGIQYDASLKMEENEKIQPMNSLHYGYGLRQGNR